MLEIPRTYNGRRIEVQDKYYPVTNVEFKVGLTENAGEKSTKGIGVFLSNISLGAEKQKDANIQSITSIEFGIPIALPFIGRDGKSTDISGFFH